jgi:hypothetical protein
MMMMVVLCCDDADTDTGDVGDSGSYVVGDGAPEQKPGNALVQRAQAQPNTTEAVGPCGVGDLFGGQRRAAAATVRLQSRVPKETWAQGKVGQPVEGGMKGIAGGGFEERGRGPDVDVLVAPGEEFWRVKGGSRKLLLQRVRPRE